MTNPFGFLKQQISPRYIGVDIGTTSIKIAEVDMGKSLPRLLNYGILESQNSFERANVALQTSSLKLFEDETAELLSSLIKKTKPTATDVIASLPTFAAFTTVLNFPMMSDDELQKTLVYQARQYVPIPLSEAAIEPVKVGEYEDEQGFKFQQILLITVPKEQIAKYQTIFKKCGLNLKYLEIEGMSLTRALAAGDPTPTYILDIGSRASSIAIIDKGQLKYVSQSDYAGATLTQALSNSLGINPLRAEELKRERGLAGTGPNYELSTIMMPFMDVILNEVKRAHFNYETQFPKAQRIERMIISGGGANLLGLEKYASKQLEIPVVKASPLSRFEYNPVLEQLVSELNPFLSVSLGLALRGLQ